MLLSRKLNFCSVPQPPRAISCKGPILLLLWPSRPKRRKREKERPPRRSLRIRRAEEETDDLGRGRGGEETFSGGVVPYSSLGQSHSQAFIPFLLDLVRCVSGKLCHSLAEDYLLLLLLSPLSFPPSSRVSHLASNLITPWNAAWLQLSGGGRCSSRQRRPRKSGDGLRGRRSGRDVRSACRRRRPPRPRRAQLGDARRQALSLSLSQSQGHGNSQGQGRDPGGPWRTLITTSQRVWEP